MLIKDQNFLFVTLGCRTNDFETSQIKSDVLKKGGKIATNQNNADIVIINTCCVTNKAMSKSKYFINKYNKLPNVKLIVVCGCFSQLDQNINNDKVGIIIGTKYKTNIVKLIQMYESKKIIKITDIVNEKKYEKPTDSCLQHKTRTIYKIQDGCNFNCTYCVIPAVRGRQRSLSHKIILDDIKKIIKNNVKEIVLTGVNTSGYNDGILNFYDLLNKIDKLKGNFRVRISSLEPFQVNKKIIDLITSNKKRWCQTFHLCLQSANDTMLKQMNRKYTFKQFMDLCLYIRSKSPFCSITTDYIVGFPTETKEWFSEGLKNLDSLMLSDIHIFPFSLHSKTPAANLKNVVSETEKKNRYLAISKLNEKNKKAYLNTMLNKTVEVLFEKSKDASFQCGHSQYFFKVYVQSKNDLSNTIKKVKLIKIYKDGVLGKLF